MSVRGAVPTATNRPARSGKKPARSCVSDAGGRETTLESARPPGASSVTRSASAIPAASDGGKNGEAEERGLRKLSRPRQPPRQRPEQRGIATVDESVEMPAGETEVAKGRRFRRIDDYCQKCHDPENDVNGNFERNWPKIATSVAAGREGERGREAAHRRRGERGA